MTSSASIVKTIAATVTGTKLKVRVTTTTAGGTATSSRLSEVANKANGTSKSAKTSVAKMPDKFRLAASASERWVKNAVVESGIKLPEAGYYAVDAKLFKGVMQDFDSRVTRRMDMLQDMISCNTDAHVSPDPDKAKTVPCYGGWTAFRQLCINQLGAEWVNDNDLFNFTSATDFLSQYTMKLEAHPLDASGSNSKLGEFAEALIQDQTINMSLNLTHSVFAGLYNDLEQCVTIINDRCPVHDHHMYSCKLDGGIISLRVSTTHGDDAIQRNNNDGTGWVSLTKSGNPIHIPGDSDDRFLAMQAIGDRYFTALAKKTGVTKTPKRWRDSAKGSSQIEPNTFRFLSDTVARAETFFRPNGVEIIEGQPELYAMLTRVGKIAGNLMKMSVSITGNNRESKQAIRRTKLADATKHIDKARTLVSTFMGE